jgi:hypothetical protein
VQPLENFLLKDCRLSSVIQKALHKTPSKDSPVLSPSLLQSFAAQINPSDHLIPSADIPLPTKGALRSSRVYSFPTDTPGNFRNFDVGGLRRLLSEHGTTATGDALEVESGPGPSFVTEVPAYGHTALVAEPEPKDCDMEGGLLNPRPAGGKARQVQDAKDMQRAVAERLTKKGLDVPPYEFQELIGKGSYGRVYKR